jgi:hypothetical protein
MLGVGGIGIVIGLATWGYRVMETVGSRGLGPLVGSTFVVAEALCMGKPYTLRVNRMCVDKPRFVFCFLSPFLVTVSDQHYSRSGLKTDLATCSLW